jgi:hypothetical protein
MAVSPDATREILQYIHDNRAMPKTIPGVDLKDLQNEFTRLWCKGLVTSDLAPVMTGLAAVVRDVIAPRLTEEGQDYLVDES